MRVLITGGGTAGHVNPALAIADIIAEKEPGSVIDYVGTETGIEGRLVPKRGMRLHPIKVKGLSRSLSPSNLKAVWEAFHASHVCKELIRDFRPDVVIGTGGYVCWPLIRAAASLGVPSVLHESNAEPGFAVRTLRKKTDLILVNFESTRDCLKDAGEKVVHVGMPVDHRFPSSKENKTLRTLLDGKSGSDLTDFRANSATAYGGKKSVSEAGNREVRILSFGGSLGAHTLNLCAIQLMRELLKNMPNVRFEHSCGTREYEEIRATFEKEGLDRYQNLILTDYIYDMPDQMTAADLVICRSGAATLAELAASGKAAILIPSPNVTGDQQRKNARQLSRAGAAIVLEDADALTEIVPTVRRLLADRDKNEMRILSEKIKDFAVPDCNEKIYAAISRLVENRKNKK